MHGMNKYNTVKAFMTNMQKLHFLLGGLNALMFNSMSLIINQFQ